MFLPPGTRQGVSALFHAVLCCGLTCLYHVPCSFLVHSRGKIFCSYLIKGCVEQWKGQTHRLFLPPRALLTLSNITVGIP